MYGSFLTIPVVVVGVGKQVILMLTQFSWAGARTNVMYGSFLSIPVVVVGVGKQVILMLTQSSWAGARTELGNNIDLFSFSTQVFDPCWV